MVLIEFPEIMRVVFIIMFGELVMTFGLLVTLIIIEAKVIGALSEIKNKRKKKTSDV